MTRNQRHHLEDNAIPAGYTVVTHINYATVRQWC